MATKKKGNLTTSPEWARHLRPIMKKWFWKGERRAEANFIRDEQKAEYSESDKDALSESENKGRP